jgi:ATP-dependent Zn protease
MVAECGMSEAVGPVYIKDASSAGPSAASALSEATKQAVDAEVRSMLVDARARVVRLLNERLPELHALSRALLEHETLTAADIQKVVAGEPLAARPPKAKAGGAAGQPAGAVEAAADGGVALEER